MKKQGFHGIIVAAGLGTRLNANVPKAYIALGGVPMIARTVSKFAALDACLSLTVVINPLHEELARETLKLFDSINFVYGGDTRQASVKCALNKMNDLSDEDIILVHDAARPFVDERIILECVDAALIHGAASAALPVADTLRRDEMIIDRKHVYAMQTPQVFRAKILRDAHAQDKMATDDTELVSELGYKIQIVHGSLMNFKITTEDDMKFAQGLIGQQKRIKTGMGYDVHAFDPAPASIIRLGGIDIPFSKKLSGHSDADVVLHAITDALYGSIADGDIGFHFPPSDMAHKNKDSAIFLEHAVARVTARGYKISHIDCVIICEEPKITPYRDAMRARIAEICEISIDDVAVKATTSEGLGFTGRKEGIAAQALVLIESLT